MPKGKRKKPQAIDFDEYLALLMKLKGDALKQIGKALEGATCFSENFLKQARQTLRNI